MALSGIQLSAGIVVGVNKPVDGKYGPYPDLATAKADIGVTLRYLGLTVGIETGGVVEEYWWESGTADADLVAKGGGGGGTWGSITGTLSDQTDLQSALDAKEDTITATTSADYYRGDKTFATLDKAAVGLSNVDNTSDADKPISSATQTALDSKEPTITATTSADYYRGDKTFATLDKTAVGLSNVDNTSDLDKPISTATQTALDAKQATITGAATTIDTEDLTASRALVSDVSGKVAVSDVTSTELGYLDGVTSAVQTQVDAKLAKYTTAYPSGSNKNIFSLAALSQTEYDAIATPDADTIYFII